jgi:hypothetical protein
VREVRPESGRRRISRVQREFKRLASLDFAAPRV